MTCCILGFQEYRRIPRQSFHKIQSLLKKAPHIVAHSLGDDVIKGKLLQLFLSVQNPRNPIIEQPNALLLPSIWLQLCTCLCICAGLPAFAPHHTFQVNFLLMHSRLRENLFGLQLQPTKWSLCVFCGSLACVCMMAEKHLSTP